MRQVPMNLFRKFILYYKICAVILLNTCIIFLLANIIFSFTRKIKRTYSKPINMMYKTYGKSLHKIYPGLSEEEIKILLGETRSRPYVYEPFTTFKERPYNGRYVNVDKNGFRNSRNQGVWPPAFENFNVFVFGGSTLFGYGVSDEQTTASYLQEFLEGRGLRKNVRVYNFGRGYYYSTQEFILFARLASSGFIPDMAIFIDGLNEFIFYNDEPYHSDILRDFIDANINENFLRNYPFSYFLYKIPLIGYIKRKLDVILAKGNTTQKIGSLGDDQYRYEPIIRKVIDRYIQNKKCVEAIAQAYGIQPIFVWQPMPLYQYDLKYHLYYYKIEQHIYAKYGYPRMAEFVKKESLGKNFLWLADMQEELKEPLYVDTHHYSAEMHKRFARAICNLLQERGFLKSDKN